MPDTGKGSLCLRLSLHEFVCVPPGEHCVCVLEPGAQHVCVLSGNTSSGH